MKKLLKIILYGLCAALLIGCSSQTVMSEGIKEENEEMNTEAVVNIVYPQLNARPIENRPLSEDAETTEAPIKEFVSSDASITFTYEYIEDSDVMPYGLLTPSTAETNKQTPLIVWLHGSGEVGVGKSTFNAYGLPPVLNNWELEGFNAYVVMPQLIGDFNTGNWMNKQAVENINSLINKLRLEYRIDEERIILCGHSLGGQGTAYVANALPDLFSCIAPLSGYNCGIELENINIPIWAIVGHPAYGEDDASYNYVTKKFAELCPDADILVLDSSHGDLPKKAFNLDDNSDGKSDLIEWMLNNRREIVGVG